MARTSDFLKNGLHDAVKEHTDYDGSNRVSKVYTAPIYANNGDPCLVTEYQYVGASGRISGRKEYEGTWDSTWDF